MMIAIISQAVEDIENNYGIFHCRSQGRELRMRCLNKYKLL